MQVVALGLMAAAMPVVAGQAAGPQAAGQQAPAQEAVASVAAAPTDAVVQTDAPPRPPVEGATDTGGEGDTEGVEDIVVNGSRTLPGSVVGDIPPEQSLGQADIRSYGVSSVNDLLTELGPQIQSGRGEGGPPVVLLNGRRISGFEEIRDLPTEAIARVDILPEEVALKYGYRADQKVVNFVLVRRFRAATAELSGGVATQGGRNRVNPELDLLNIRNNGRLNLHIEYEHNGALTEAERGITQQPTLFTPVGNVVGTGGGAIDPALGTATVAGVPVSSGRPSLADFAATAGTASANGDLGRYRTLLPATRSLQLNGVYARTFGTTSATVNGRLEVTDSTAQQGLPSAALTLPAGNPFSPFAGAVTVDRAITGFNPLLQRNSNITAHLATSINGALSGWQWSLTGNYDRVASSTTTDLGLDTSAFQARLLANDPTANPFAAFGAGDLLALPSNRARSVASVGQANLLVTGSPFSVPAGRVTTSVRVGGSTSDLDSRSFRSGRTTIGAVSRDIGSGSVNIDVPLTSVSKGVLGAIGNLSVNGNAQVEQLSDFGTLTTWGYGLNWSPLLGVRVIASHTDDENAPSAQQLGNPVVQTPNVRVFDYVTGTTQTVTTITGGNPTLDGNTRHVTKIGLNLKPFTQTDLSIIANYVRNTTDNPIAGFPTPTAVIESAFPGRFTRSASGQLLTLDTRPINFARRERSELRYGFNYSHPLKSRLQKQLEAFREGKGPNPFEGLQVPGQFRRPGAQGGQPGQGAQGGQPGQGAQAGPGGGRGFGGGGFGGRGGGRGGGGGRLQFALYHTWHFTDRVDIGQNGPFLDLLNGDAIGQSGGQPRHELEGQAGYTNNGIGARLSVNYASSSQVTGGTAAVPTALNFSSLTTANLRLFLDANGRLDLVRAHPWLRGTRVVLSFDNVFNTRQRVTDATGTVPISFQPGYLDPLGRSVRLTVRKLFF